MGQGGGGLYLGTPAHNASISQFLLVLCVVNSSPRLILLERHLTHFLGIDAADVSREGEHFACIFRKALHAAGYRSFGPGGADRDNAGRCTICIDIRFSVYGSYS